MAEWEYAQRRPEDRLAKIETYSVVTSQNGREIDFQITVREYVTPRDPVMKFFAQSNRQTNQKTMSFTPTGWGTTLLKALSDCVTAIHKFPYEGD